MTELFDVLMSGGFSPLSLMPAGENERLFLALDEN